MRSIRDAANALQRNIGPLVFYLVCAVFLGELFVGFRLLEQHKVIELESPDKELCLLALQVAMAAGFATVRCIVFARMGREIDRPLWKISGDREALRRFLGLWIALGLVSVILTQLGLALGGNDAGDQHPLALLPLLGLLVVVLGGVPVCTCIMFWGKVEPGHLLEALTPLGKQFGRVFPLVALNLLGWLIQVLRVEFDEHPALVMVSAAILLVVAIYIECLVFAGVWLACMIDRDTIEEPDFDF
jgi:hypothetical protein